ncbi:2-oxoglutarate oxidoreductase subunit KorB [Anaerohalosphaera lusitana]|uniref:2-oxoglutarate oxidoreductase subunit KorB n=1 Tax=Anaerohalosphaera lusitana TaxID=1936003 RepID=A0A1U9NLR1_9BACT|nr:thiamine pyrophosphate-dependent enzyme [Anaerohalosphaera lusitana]AQT68426.1 2-oxoglutarate oxidoreductase subunit KorB [Anaerohalosphaera lusitana]
MEFKKTKVLKDNPTHYCPGCGHGIVHRLVAECIDELGIRERTIGTAPVGCAVLLYNYFDCDIIECSHGRSPATATGIKRVHPDKIVFTYQGDGDLAAIGTAETIHAANRGENITVIFVNNAIYGMTGGQMAPTTMIGQKSTTSPRGRGENHEGPPIKVCELLSKLDGVEYLERVAVNSAKDVRRAKKAIRKGFTNQLGDKGFSLIEVLSMCPTDWKIKPAEAVNFVEEDMKKVFPLGVYKNRSGD